MVLYIHRSYHVFYGIKFSSSYECSYIAVYDLRILYTKSNMFLLFTHIGHVMQGHTTPTVNDTLPIIELLQLWMVGLGKLSGYCVS